MSSLSSRFFLPLLMLVMLLAGVACSESESAPPPPADASTTTADIRISIAGMFTPKETYSIYSELLDYIAEKTGHSTVLQQTGSYTNVNDLLANRQTDFALLCSGGYVEASHHLDLDPLVAPVVDGQPLYYSYIITRADSGIEKFADFQGRRFAFGDPLSLTGTLFPMSRLQAAGSSPDSFFADYIYTNNHDNSIKAVRESVVDGAAVDSFIFDYMQAHDAGSVEGLVIIEKSPPYGSPPIVARPGLPDSLRDVMVQVLVGMADDSKGREILAKLGIERFAKVDASLYLSVEQMEAEMTSNR